MVVTREGENRKMAEELVVLKTKFEDMDKMFLSLHLQHSIMSNRRQVESSADTGSLLLVTFMDRSLIFLASMVMIRKNGFIRQNNISVCITLLMSIKSHLHPSIWKINPFNGSIGTSRPHIVPNWIDFFQQFGLSALMTS